MKIKSLFTRYHWLIFFILLILTYFPVKYAVRQYKRNQPSIYDLTWPDRTDANSIVYRRWRYYFKANTNLPHRIEKYYRIDPNNSYILEEILVITYPTDEEIQQVIKDAGF
ncbi:hypothetical protein ACFL3G_12455 [Planctomycetota bacterium]